MAHLYSVSISGIRLAEEKFDRAARNIAEGRSRRDQKQADSVDTVQISSEAYRSAASVDGVDYPKEFVSILEAKTAFKANLKAVAAEDELQKNVLDLMG